MKSMDVRLTFNNQWFYQQQEGEKNSGISIVDPSGYVDAKTRIENLMRAGEQLDEARREMYHFGKSDEDDEYEDPMMEPGLDLADVHRMRRDSIRRLAEQAAKKQSEDSVAKESDSKSTADPQKTEAKPMVSLAGGGEQAGESS